MRPRLTPSTGISTLRASSAARRNVPSPPRTRTSSHPSAARSSASTTSTSTPSPRMSSVEECTAPRSTASADSTRRPIPLSPSTFSTLRAVSATSSRPVCTTSRMVRSVVIAALRRRRVATACSSSSPVSGCSGLARRCRKYSTLPDGPGSGLAVDTDGVPVQFGGPARDREHRACAQLRIRHRPRLRRLGPCRPRTVVSPWERYRRPPTRTKPARAAPSTAR